MRPRIGVSSVAADAASWTEWCRALEAAGIDEISVADHLKAGLVPPLTALAAAATVTERVALSTMVLNNELRHPGVLASEVAFVSELSGGRLTLGIGAGHAQDEHDALGLALPPPADRIARLDESVAALRGLLAGETVTTAGPHLCLTELTTTATPAPAVPLLVGGGARGVLQVAARHADIVGLTGFSRASGATRYTHFTADGLAERLAFARGLPRELRRPLGFQALVQLLTVTDDRRSAAVRIAADWGDALPLTVDDLLESPFLLLGTVAQIAEQLHERSARFGIETWTVFAGRAIDAPLSAVAAVRRALDG